MNVHTHELCTEVHAAVDPEHFTTRNGREWTQPHCAECGAALTGYDPDKYRYCPECDADLYADETYRTTGHHYCDMTYRCGICGSDDRNEHNDEMHAQEARATTDY